MEAVKISNNDKELSFFDSSLIDRVNSMFEKETPFPSEMFEALIKRMKKGWLTRIYFTKGRHNLVLPSWLLGKLGPDGEAMHGIYGLPILTNTDLRSYYALGSPDSLREPVVDHRGGIIPLPESYTLMFGTLINNKPRYTSEIGDVKVELHEEGYPMVTVTWEVEDDLMIYDVFADREDDIEALCISVVRGFANHPLFFTLCPLDQDGVTEVPSIVYNNKSLILNPENHPRIKISEPAIRSVTLPLAKGHAGRIINKSTASSYDATCDAKSASWAAIYPVRSNPSFVIPLNDVDEIPNFFPDDDVIEEKWEEFVETIPELNISDDRIEDLYRNSIIVLRLLTDLERSTITVGPSVQEKWWLPALAFQTMALDRVGMAECCSRPILNALLDQIDNNGLLTNTAQWDAQGALVQAITHHFFITKDFNWLGEKFSTLKRIGDWVLRNKKKQEGSDISRINGLMSEGIAPWFDPLYWENDFYYSNNFWSASILKNLYLLGSEIGKHGEAERYKVEFVKFRQDIDDTITLAMDNRDFIPAGPFKSDSAELIFNMYAYYPLQLHTPAFMPLVKTYEHIVKNYMHDGGVLIDQPWNAYGASYTILMGQVCRYLEKYDLIPDIIDFMLENKTNKQGWAEGISPKTKRGSVGDSPNGFVAAMWVNFILDMIVENQFDDDPIFLKGAPKKWLEEGISVKDFIGINGSKISIDAKLTKNVFTLKWDIKTDDEVFPYISMPYQLEKIPSNLSQITSHLFKLPKKSGELKVKLKL